MLFVPHRITRYVLKELATPTILGLSLWTFFLLMNHFFVVAEKALAKNLSWDLVLRLFATGIPNLMVLAIPMAVLLGSLIGVGRLSADHEWVALQGAGAGPWRLLRPLLIHGMLASLACMVVYAYVVPRANYALRNLRGQVLFASNLASDLRPRVFYSDLPDVVLYVNDIRPGSEGRLAGVLFIETNRQARSAVLTLARSGDLYPDPDGSGDLILDLHEGEAISYQFDAPQESDLTRFNSFQKRIKAAQYLKGLLDPPDRVVQDFSPVELVAEVRNAGEGFRQAELDSAAGNSQGADLLMARTRLGRATLELNQRIALPMASFFFAILALPLGVTRVRSGKGAGFALSLMVILVYWASFTFARDQALRGRLSPTLGPWVANLVIIPWAAYGLWRMRRPPSDGFGPLVWFRALLARTARLLPGRRLRTANGEALAGQDPSAVGEVGELTELGGTTTRFIGRIDQYIGLQFLRLLIISVVATYMIYGLVESKNLLDGAIRSQQPFSLIFSYFKYFPPGVLNLVMPIACLIAAVLTYTLLSRTGELTAIKAGGISMRRATAPVLVLTVLLCGVLYVVQDRIAPASNRRAQEIKDRILGRAPRTYGSALNGAWAFGPDGTRLYQARFYDDQTREFQDLRIFTLDRDAPRIVNHRFAERARWKGNLWELDGGWYRAFSPSGAQTFQTQENVVELELDPPNYFSGRHSRLYSGSKLPQQMSFAELDAQIRTLQNSGFDITRLRVEYYGKIAHAVTPLVMVLLGLPFAFRVGNRGALYSIGVALILVLAYWAVFAIFNALGLETLFDPLVAAWAPNILFGLLGVYLMLYVRT